MLGEGVEKGGPPPYTAGRNVSCLQPLRKTGWRFLKRLILHLPYDLAILLSHPVMFNSFRTHRLQPARLLCPWGFSRQEYWTGLPCPPPWDLPNPDLPHRKQILYRLSHQGIPRILEWVAYPFSRVSTLPRNRTGVSCLADRFFAN